MNYQKHYNQLIERAKNRSIIGYQEKHRIVPGCMGGTYVANNIVRLTAEEHYVAHQLLVKIYPDNHKLVYAANMMISKNYYQKRNNKTYGWLRRRLSSCISEMNKGKIPWNKGLTKENDERVRKQSITQTGVKKTEEHKQKLAVAMSGENNPNFGKPAWNRGIPRTEEWRINHSLMMKGRTFTQAHKNAISTKAKQRPIVTCPHCNKSGQKNAMARWHFDKCKF